jgi:flagellar motility protein MotE (MotC chaperone)
MKLLPARLSIAALLALAAVIAAKAVRAEPPAPHGEAPPAVVTPVVKAPAARPFVSEGTPAENYCANIADAAADARFAWQARTLADLQKALDGKIAALEAKRQETEEWLKRREDFLKKAEDSVVAIYAKMRPDAASIQIARMDEESAAALLTKLSSRAASAILNEMEPARAARLTAAMSGMPSPKEDSAS